MKILQLLKKKKWIIPVVSLLLSLTVGAVVIFTYNRNDEPLAPPSNSMSICLTPPSEGNPNDYSGLDNIGYIAGKLRSQPYFHSESKGSVNTMVTQDFLGYKDYKDGKLIASTISIAHSNLAPSNAIQKFFSDGKVVIRRAQSDNPSDWDGDNTVWATGAPSEVLDENAYIMRYGLPATELTEFIINAESLISCTTPVKGEDGVYTMTAKLDNEKSTYYYRMQMKTMGGLNSYPSFQNIEITFHFQEDWTLLSMDVHEEYETYVSVITAACVADTNVVFSYEEDKVDVSPYEDYFKEYANADTTETVEPERTATTYLASGFGPLINGQKCLSFTASVGENSFDGLIDLDMSLVPAMELKGLQLNIGGLVAGLKGEDIVVHYKDFTGKLALDELTSLFASGGNDGGSADGGVSLDTEALLDGIMNAPIVRENGKAIISAELDVAGMPISICFTFDDGEEVQLEKVEAALTLMDIPVKLEAQLCDKSAFPNVSFGAAVDLAPYIEDVKAFIENKAFAVDITYGNAGDELQVVGSAVLNIKDGLSAYVSAQVTYAGATLPVELTFVDNTVYVSANGIRLQGTVDEIKALVNEILPLVSKDGAQSMDELLPAMPEIKVEQILGAVFAVSFDEILTTLSVSDESLNITVDGDKLLTVLKDLVGDINFELGDIELGYDRASGTVTASVLGANVTLTSTTDSVNIPDGAADFVSLADVTPIVHSVVEALTAEHLAFNATLSTTVEGLDIGVDVEGYVTLGEQIGVYAKVNLAIFGGVETLEILYKDGGLTVVYGGVALQVTKDDVNIIVEQIVEIFGGDSESGEAQPLTDTEGTIDIIGLVNAIALTSETDGELTKLRLTAALAGIFGAETVSDLDATLFVSGGRTRVETSALTVSGITLENVALGIGAVETVAEPDFSSVPVCKNVLEFLLAAYRELADSEYASLDFGFKTNEMNVSLNGLVQFASKENSTASIINVDAKAEIETFKWDDAASAYVSSGTHYIHLTILEEQLWASYSLKGMDADTAVYVTLPISELFVAGQTVLPLMAPMLGISEDIYYYDFIVKILDGKYPTINTDIIDMMTLEEWIALVLRAIEAEGVALATEEVESSNTAVQPTVSFGESAEGNTTIAVDAGEMSATITMLTNGAAAITVPTNKTYIDISTIATLLTDVLHAYDYAKNYNGYALSGSLAIGVGSLDLKNIGVNLQIKTDDGISVAATITPKSGTTTYLTVKDGMFYITRVVVKEDRRMTGFFKWTTYIVTTTEHRAMTAEQFLGDMMEQIYFILNLSDTEIWIIDTAMKNSTPSTGPSEYDAGDMVKNYSFTPVSGADKATYDITLSLGAIMNNSAFGDVSATITREKLSGKDYYDLTNISATVGISVLKASINLTHDGAKDVNNIKPQTVAENVARVVSGLGYMDEAAVKAATAGGIVSYSNTTEVVKS